MHNIQIANNGKIYDPFIDGLTDEYDNKLSRLTYPDVVASRNFEPILNSVKRASEKIAFDNTLEDSFKISQLQGKLNKFGFTDYDGNRLIEDGVFGFKTKAAYDNAFQPAKYPDMSTEKLRTKNQELVSRGLDLQRQIVQNYGEANPNQHLEIANYQRDLNDAGFTDFDDKPLKEDGIFGPVTQSAINSYIWEDNNVGIIALSSKAREKPGWIENPNKRKGSENRQPGGDRERNVGHPDGEEHSRVPKGTGGQGVRRVETQENIGDALLGGAAAAGAGYLIYKGVRLLPSLLPPLWWTIPGNLLVP